MAWPPVPVYSKLFEEESQFAPPEPPAPPAGDTFTAFGNESSTRLLFPTLAENGVQVLYDANASASSELKRLNKSALVQYCEIVEGLISEGDAKLDDRLSSLETMLINMHYLVNTHRPQQASDALVSMLRETIKRNRDLSEGLKAACDDAERVLEALKAEQQAEKNNDNNNNNNNNNDANDEVTEGRKRIRKLE
jgi:hypothetical protein